MSPPQPQIGKQPSLIKPQPQQQQQQQQQQQRPAQQQQQVYLAPKTMFSKRERVNVHGVKSYFLLYGVPALVLMVGIFVS